MDLHNDQCLNLRDCVGFGASAVKTVKKQKSRVVLDSGRPLVPSAKFTSFPASISHLVGEYLPIDERSCVETAFAGVQPITLCLSQDLDSKLVSCWSIGFLPPNRQWKPSNVKIDKEYLLQDYEGCLELLKQEDSNYCQVAIDVLVVKLSETLNDFPSALCNLRTTIRELKDHLGSVKHVVFSIKEIVSCCFTPNDAVGKVDEMRQSVDNSKAIFEILDDLYVCWKNYSKLTVRQLFNFYFKSEAKPPSEMYLAKLIIPLNTFYNRKLFKEEASHMLSNKIMWAYFLTSLDDSFRIFQNTTRLCHAFHFDLSNVKNSDAQRLGDGLRDVLYFQDNRFIERIVINSGEFIRRIQLPRPSASLTDATPRSALIELTLKGDNTTVDLTQLNNGYFPHLAYLCILGGEMSGRLDSQSVPRLRTLILELGTDILLPGSDVSIRIQEHTQAIIDADRPWQLVASEDQNGWSLASYDNSTPNPHDEVKEDTPLSFPFIRELILLTETQQNADEFRSRLNGDLPLEAAKGHQNVGLLVWAPDRVEKITAFCTSGRISPLEFKDDIPGQTRILTSLTCDDLNVFLDGAALPRLQSLALKGGYATLSGTFPHLKRLSTEYTCLLSPWQVDAPLLESFDCQRLCHGNKLIFDQQSLPHLSYLRIMLYDSDIKHCPTILIDGDNSGLSRLNHVVFGNGMTKSHDFDEWQLHNVSHLELAVDPLDLPACWENTHWQCETLTINVYANNLERLFERGITELKMPLLLPRLKKLTVTEDGCPALLDSEMPELTDCTVPSPESLGRNLKCPALERICFTGQLSLVEKVLCLDHATCETIGARPRWVYFQVDGEVKRMSRDVALNETEVLLPLDELLEEVD